MHFLLLHNGLPCNIDVGPKLTLKRVSFDVFAQASDLLLKAFKILVPMQFRGRTEDFLSQCKLLDVDSRKSIRPVKRKANKGGRT